MAPGSFWELGSASGSGPPHPRGDAGMIRSGLIALSALAMLAHGSTICAQTDNQSDVTGPATTGSQTVSGVFTPPPAAPVTATVSPTVTTAASAIIVQLTAAAAPSGATPAEA